LIDYNGNILCTAEFIEMSTTKPAFYFYDRDSRKFKFYSKEKADKKYTMDFERDTQNEIWDTIIQHAPSDKLGFMFQKYEQFSKGMYY